MLQKEQLVGGDAHLWGRMAQQSPFEYSARHGLKWWEVDMTWYAICFLQAVGLATDLKLPRVAHKQRLALKPARVSS
ncbi:hypothetical protein MLD38_026038 [Melastoma candidum]|uniref:Uncharacterized protein n=1 Tax=Melastoma candidum TaxID=119954 RepID=A0ACB9NYA6_9MYRT|nr:hypothetical protein MLD38_026038 [Melastoma candidum]